jgi:hypothetical protein
MVKQDPASWEAGRVAGLAGKTGTAPASVADPLAYYSGQIEGKAERLTPRRAQSERERLHQQAETLAAALFTREMRTEVGTPEADRLKRLVRRATQRAERRYLASVPKPAP